MKRGLALLLALLLAVPLLPGCWSRTEIESLGIVGGLSIDKIQHQGSDKFLLSAAFIRPGLAGGGQQGGGAPDQPIYWRIESVGSSLTECERNINLRAPRKVFYGHMRYVIIGERMARENLMDVIDYMQRHGDIRLRTLVLVTRGSASELLVRFSELENTISGQVIGMKDTAAPRVSKFIIKNLAETTDELITPGQDPVIAQIYPVTSPPTEPGKGPLPTFAFDGGGVIRKQKLVGWFDQNDILGFLLATGQAKQAAFPVKLGARAAVATINLTRASGKVKVDVKEGKVTATIEINAEGDLAEYHGEEEIAVKEKNPLIEKALAQAIAKEVKRAVKKAQQLNADVFGFGAALHRGHPDVWKELEPKWYDIFPHVQVDMKITAHIRRTGLISDPYIAK